MAFCASSMTQGPPELRGGHTALSPLAIGSLKRSESRIRVTLRDRSQELGLREVPSAFYPPSPRPPSRSLQG